MNPKNKYCIFILSYGKPNKSTYELFGSCECEKFIVCSDDDAFLDEYKKIYGDKVVVFNKMTAKKEFNLDPMTNKPNFGCPIFARAYVFKIAKRLGYKFFIVLDDDYNKVEVFPNGCKKRICITKNKNTHILRFVVDEVFRLFSETKTIKTMSFGQGGDYFGGVNSPALRKYKRKAMNSFFCSTDRYVEFVGNTNEDVNMYITLNGVCFSVKNVSITQDETQQHAGGMTQIYLEQGTFVKSMFSVVLRPDCVRLNLMGAKNYRVHHLIDWNSCVPKIIREH